MFFGKKDDKASLEDKLKEIEQRVKGLGKKEQQVSQSQPPSISQAPPQQNVEEEKQKEEKVEEETQVPLFVKLDKYKTCLLYTSPSPRD